MIMITLNRNIRKYKTVGQENHWIFSLFDDKQNGLTVIDNDGENNNKSKPATRMNWPTKKSMITKTENPNKNYIKSR